MRKIVSTLFAFVIAISGFSYSFTFTKENTFSSGMPSKGLKDISWTHPLDAASNYDIKLDMHSDFSSSIGATLIKNGVSITNGALEITSNGSKAVSVTITLGNSNYSIKSVSFYVRDNKLSTLNLNGQEDYRTSLEVNTKNADGTAATYCYHIENNYQEITQVSLSGKFEKATKIDSIKVEYGKLINDITLLDTEAYPFDCDVWTNSVTYKRLGMTDTWATLCLPFEFNTSNAKGFGVYSFDAITGSELIANRLENYTNSACEPVLIRMNQGSTDLIVSAENVMLEYSKYSSKYSGSNNGKVYTSNRTSFDGKYVYKMYGTLDKKVVVEDGGFFITKDQFYAIPNGKVGIKPYRAWVSTSNSVFASRLRGLLLDSNTFESNEATAIDEVDDDIISENYNIKGISTISNMKGLVLRKESGSMKKIFLK